MHNLWPALTTLLALGGRKSPAPHGYRPRPGAPAPARSPRPSIVRFQVCLSPGCTADGAVDTLEKLQALAPAHVIVEDGSCVSLCGSGPVVQATTSEDKASVTTKFKRIANDERVLQILYPEGGAPLELLEGYLLVQQGDVEFTGKAYAEALRLYERAIMVAFRSAVELENERDTLLKLESNSQSATNGGTSRSTKTRVPTGLAWLIRARRHEALCKIQLGDLDGAMLAAQASCNLSRNTSAEAFLVLAEIYQLEDVLEGENQALDKAISLWADETKLTFPQKNQQRLATLRLQKVKRQLLAAQPAVEAIVSDETASEDTSTEANAPESDAEGDEERLQVKALANKEERDEPKAHHRNGAEAPDEEGEAKVDIPGDN
jgi:tetratricopeptide (TPR) repeat protein